MLILIAMIVAKRNKNGARIEMRSAILAKLETTTMSLVKRVINDETSNLSKLANEKV